MKGQLQPHISKLTSQNFLILDISELYHEYNPYIGELDLSKINADVINSIDADIILIDLASPYLQIIDENELYKVMQNVNTTKTWYILTSNCEYYKNKHPSIVYYPLYIIDVIDKTKRQTVDIIKKRNHSLGFLTYQMHAHRIISLIELQKQSWFDTTLVNIIPCANMTESQLNGYTNAFAMLTPVECAQLEKLMELAPLIADKDDDQTGLVGIKNKAFTDAYINMFTESDYPRLYITEKSIKPFLSGQFTAVLAHPAVYAHLKELGFDLFDDVIDLVSTTNTGDVRTNINNVIERITNLIPDIEKVWDDTYIRRQHNYTLARSPKLREELCRELREKLNGI